jgi:general secretion pathway protein E
MTAPDTFPRREHRLELPELVARLQADGRLSEADARRLTGVNIGSVHPLVFLAEQKLADASRPGVTLDMDRLLNWLGAQVGQAVYEIDPLRINVAAVSEVMSRAFAERHRILAVEAREDRVLVASAEPFITAWQDNLEHVARRPVERVLADPRDILRYTAEFYTMARSVRGARASGAGRSGAPAGVTNLEQLLEMGSRQELDANDQHVVSIVDWLLQYAFEQRASDIHVEPRREVGKVRFRIDGVLHPVYELPQAVCSAMTSRIKILGRMDVAEKRRPQDGRLKTRSPAGSEIELRLSTLPTAFGEKLVMRIFDPEVLHKGFAELGLEDDDLARWQAMTGAGNGIALVTGPTGSGKTTTLYSTLRALATDEVNVCTVEDPIEMVEDRFNQMQVNHGIGLDFSTGVRTLLRQDPDIIMVGEIRDLETAHMAVQAALTGHLVLSTLHTNDSPSSISRLLELGVPAYLVRATVRGVMSQRLVRMLCEHCKVPETADARAWATLVGEAGPPPAEVYTAVGCRACRQTGYMGRRGIYEVLLSSPEVQEKIVSRIDTRALRGVAAQQGMRSLRESGAMRVLRGETTIDEVLRVVPLGE